MQIILRDLLGKRRCVEVKPSNTIAELKAKLYLSEDIHPDEQRIIYAGQQLEDNRTFLDYGIQEDSTIHLILRLRGSMESKVVNSDKIENCKVKIQQYRNLALLA